MASAVTKTAPAWKQALQRWAYGISYFPQIGLMRDDIRHETPDVEEALRRLSRDVMAERSFRISRAFQLSIRKEILPRDEWTKLENDVLYLTPLVEEVRKEREEREAWNKK